MSSLYINQIIKSRLFIMKRFSIYIMFIFFALPMYAQEDYKIYLEQAQSFFSEGEYTKAHKALNVYVQMTNDKQTELETKISQCLNYENLARSAKENNNYTMAISYYNKIIQINPTDINTKKRIDETRSLQNYTKSSTTYNTTIVKKKLVNDISDISWVVGVGSGNVCGDALGVYTTLKFGNPSGFAIEGGYSPGITSVNTWSAGLKGYWKSLYGSVHYGTTMPIYGKELEPTITDSGEIIAEGSRNYGKYGFSVLVGYDKVFYKGFHLTFGAGIMIPTESVKETRVLPAWNVGIGYDLFSLPKRGK